MKKNYDLIIVGADAAGLTAGIYAGRKKVDALILSQKIGGQSLFTDSMENYPGFLKISGMELIGRLSEQVKKFEVPIKEEEVLSVSGDIGDFSVKTQGGEYKAPKIIIATGSGWRPLNIPGEEKFMGKGVSVCAICDAPFYSGKDVAVVGGGNSAFESALDLLKYAGKIYILQHREKFVGDAVPFEKLKKEKSVVFITSAETKEIKGDKFVEGLLYEDLKTGETKELKVSGVFVNIGRIPNTSFLKDFVDLNERGEIVIDSKTNTTSRPGIFAAGDVTDVKFKQFVIAAAEGAKAVLSATDSLEND